MELSIIILNYKSAGLVKQCLLGLRLVQLNIPHEIIVIDNNSKDSIREVLKKFPEVRPIYLEKNKGFAAGNNAGIKAAKGRYILLLNPDIAVLAGAIEKMVLFLEKHPRSGMVVPQLLNPDRSVQMSVMKFPKFLMPLYRRTAFGKSRRAQGILDDYLMSDWNHTDTRRIDWALGACLLVKREAVDDVGFLDERYFLYVEDTDWCRRFWEKRWEIYYVHDAQMVHYHMRESASKFFSRLNLIHILSWLKYFSKFGLKKNSKNLFEIDKTLLKQ